VGDLILCQSKKKFTPGSGKIIIDKIAIVLKLETDDDGNSELFILRVGNH
jgi:hypothetical protein